MHAAFEYAGLLHLPRSLPGSGLCWILRHCIFGEHLVRQPGKTCLDTSGMAFRSRVDNSLRSHGLVRLPHLENRGISGLPHLPSFLDTARIEFRLVLAFFLLPPSRLGFWGTPAPFGSDPLEPCSFSEPGPSSGRHAGTLSALGKLCGSIELHDMAHESSIKTRDAKWYCPGFFRSGRFRGSVVWFHHVPSLTPKGAWWHRKRYEKRFYSFQGESPRAKRLRQASATFASKRVPL